MLTVNIRDARGTGTLAVRFFVSRDSGREVRFTIFDPREPFVSLSEIVASSIALRTQKYDIQTLNADIAEHALDACSSFHSVSKIIHDEAQHSNMTTAEILSLYYVSIASGNVTLELKHGTKE